MQHRFLFFCSFFAVFAAPVFAQKFKAERRATDSLYLLGQYSEAIEIASRTLDRACANGPDTVCALWHHQRGNCFRAKKMSREAEADYRASLAIRGRQPKRGSEFASSLHGLGTALFDQDRLIESRAALLWSIALRDSNGQKPNRTYAASVNGLGNVAANLGNLTEAERFYERSLQIFKDLFGTDCREYATALSNLAAVAAELGNFDQALVLQKKALDQRLKMFTRDHELYASAVSNLARLHANIENWPTAESRYRESIAIYSSLKDFGPDCASALYDRASLARILMEKGQIDEADSVIRAVVATTDATADSVKFAWTKAVFGQILLKKGQFNAAKAAFRTAIRQQRGQLSDRDPSYLRSLEGLAEAALLTRDWAEADSIFEEIQTQELAEIETFFPKMSDRERQVFFRPIQRRFERFASLVWQAEAVRPDLVGRLFDLRLATRGLLFSASQKMRDQFRASGDLADYEKWLQTRERLAALQLRTATETEAWGLSIPELFEESRRLEKKLRQASPSFWEQTKAQQPDWRLVQLALEKDEAAVEIIRFREQRSDGADSVFYLALVLTAETAERPEVVRFGDGAELETVFFELFRDEIRRPAPAAPRLSPSYFAFWQPLEAVLQGKKRIFIAPDGVFHKINLAALRRPDGSVLFDSLDLRTVTSLGDLVSVGKKAVAQPAQSLFSALLVGAPSFDFSDQNAAAASEKSSSDRSVFDELRNVRLRPLAEAEQEIHEIQRLFEAKKWAVTSLTGTAATEAEVKKANAPTVAHFATHGLFLENLEADGVFFDTSFVSKSPLLRSMLFFAGAQNTLDGRAVGSEQDGILTAMEAQNLRLDGTDLVVLSACETADGELQNGEGVFGLQRAFRVAGAQSLLMSLWNVDDAATRRLMVVFYENWLGGATKRDAFRTAQKAVRAEFGLAAHWASFVLLGE